MTDPSGVARELEAQLRAAGTPERAVKEKAYLKSSMQHLGTTVPAINRITKACTTDVRTHDDVLAVVRLLWGRPFHECRFAATELLARRAELITVGDAPYLETLIREAGTWALVDPLAAEAVGVPALSDARWWDVTDRWLGDDDFWVRRSAMLALLPSVRRGEQTERLVRYADALCGEREFFIRKAVGWVMREAGRATPDVVTAWLDAHTGALSAVTWREAVKWLPDRDRLVSAFAGRRP